MKITTPSEKLMEALRKVLSVVSPRTTIPVLSNVLLVAKDGLLTLTTTDLEVSITIAIEAEVAEEGETTLPAKKFGQIVSTLPSGEVVLTTDESMTTSISCAQAHFKIMGMDASEFPKEGEFEEDRKFSLPSLEFGKTLRKIGYAVSTDQSRYVLSGILLSIRDGNFTAVATDGRRLALVEKAIDDADGIPDGDVILPAKVVTELQRLLDSEGELVIKLSESRASFTSGSLVVISKLVEGSYPNYRQVIPSSFSNSLVLPRERFAEVLHRVSVVVMESGASIKVNLEPTRIVLSASSSDVGEANEPLEVPYDGEQLEMSFNPGFLADPLRCLDCDEFTLRFNDQFKPAVMLGDEGFLYVIMPMRS